MNRILKRITAVLMAGVVAGCSPGTGMENQHEPIQDNNHAEGKSIVKIAVNTEPDSLDPYISAASDTEAMMLNVFEGLVGADENGTIVPRLAKDFETADGLEYIFYLQEEVLFHNGKPFSAEDVVYSLKRLSGLDGGPGASSKFSHVAEVAALDDYTVKVVLSELDSSFLSKCMDAVIPSGYTEQASHPIGTGPYQFESYNPGQSLKLVLNEAYYLEDRFGAIEEAEFVFMSDENAKLLAIRSGTIHLFDAAKEIIDQLPDESFQKYHNLSNTVQLLALNNTKEPFDDINVRRAVNYAVNRDEVSLFVTGGEGYGIYTTMSPATLWYNDRTETVYSYDPDYAETLLAQAGYPDGFDMELTVASNYLINVNAAQVIAGQLEKIGINVSINQVEWGQWLEEVYAGGNYHSSVVGLTGKVDPHEVMNRFHSQYIRNFYHYNNLAYDILIEEGYRETDDGLRREIYNQAQMLLTEDAAAVFILDPGSDVASVPALKGYTSYPITFWDLSALYFE